MGSNDLKKFITIDHTNKERIRNSITENLTRTTKIRKIPFNNFMLMITSMNILCAYVDRKNSFISAKEIIFFCLTRCFWNTKRMRILNGTCPDLKKRELPFFLMSLTDFIHMIVHAIPLKYRGPFDEYLFPFSMIIISKYTLISQMNKQDYSKPYKPYQKYAIYVENITLDII